jgi:hypothetical protein
MKKKLLGLVLIGTLGFATACSTSWLTTFEDYVKIAGPILTEILGIVSEVNGTPVNSQLVAKISSDSAAVTSLAQSISTAAAENVQGTCAQFNLAVSTLDSDLSSIEQLANVGTHTSQEIAASLGIAQAVFAQIEAPIAACQSATSNAAAVRAVKTTLSKGNVPSPQNLVQAFDAIVGPKHQVHLHGKFVQYGSFDRLQ